MSKFTLKRVLELKERREQAAAVRLVEARTRAESARSAAEGLQRRREEVSHQRSTAQMSARTVGHLQNAAYVLERLDRELDEAGDVVREADELVAACLEEFALASRERQVLSRLSERHREAAQAKAVQADRTAMDAIALSRYVRGRRVGISAGEGP